MPIYLLCSWSITCFCNSSGIMMDLPFIIITSLLPNDLWVSSNVSFLCNFISACRQSMYGKFFLTFLCIHLGVLLAVYLVLTCILGYLLLHVRHQCLSSFQVFLCLCSPHDFVVTTSLLWIGLVCACIVSWFCIGGLLVVCVKVFVIALLCPSSWSLLMPFDPRLHLPV